MSAPALPTPSPSPSAFELFCFLHVTAALIPILVLMLYRNHWKFSLRQMFIVMTVCCLLMASAPRVWAVTKYPGGFRYALLAGVIHFSDTCVVVFLVSALGCWLVNRYLLRPRAEKA